MHLHLVRGVARPTQAPLPAKLVVLATRRQARLEQARRERQTPRPAA